MKTKFTIDSRIISHLGEALISDEKIALLELIKNSSDADALNCNIEIDTHFVSPYGLGKITLEDNGNGMNPFIIENAFLKIATTFKTKHQKVSPIYKRIALGSKGIGRLALNQLGTFVEIETKLNTDIFKYIEDLQMTFGKSNVQQLINENQDNNYKFAINWSKYEKASSALEDVDIDIETVQHSDNLYCGASHGTRITVYGLKGISFWEHKNTKKGLEKDVLSFINPFLPKKVNFKVKINLNNEIFRSDIYDRKRIENIADVTSSFWYVSNEKKLFIHIKRNPHYIRNLIENLLSRMDIEEFECVTKNINYECYYKEYSIKEEVIVLNEEDINEKSPRSDIKHLFTDIEGNYLLPGDFEGVLYGFNRQSKNTAVKSEIRNLLNSISGIKMYRNNFRVFPYGESDWLELGKISQMQFSNIYTPGNTTGYVYIDGEENLSKLTELTNREGLVQNNYGKNFLLVMQEIVSKFIAYEDNKLRNNELNIPKSKRDKANPGDILNLKFGNISFVKKEDPNISAKNDLENSQSTISKNINNIYSDIKSEEDREKLKRLQVTINNELINVKHNLSQIENIKDKRKEQVKLEENYIKQFYPIIGATIIAETLSHEIIRLSNNIKHSSLQIRNLFKSDLPKVDTKFIINHLSLIDSNTKFLTRYASLLDVNTYSKRRKYEVENLKLYLTKNFNETPLLKLRNIEVNLVFSGTGFEKRIIKEGLNIVFENIIINSVYWLERNRVSNPTIFVDFNKENSSVKIWDNGKGVHEDISDNIFEPFKTNKPNNEGRGMGLFIVKELLKEFDADIYLLNEINEHRRKYIFEIRFKEEL